MTLPDLPGILTAAEIEATARSIAELQLPDGMIPWYPGGHCDPWNHVETAMALDVAGFHDEARHAYRWLADVQRPDGSWHNYYLPGGGIEDPKLDTNVCAYIGTGLWHHWLCTGHQAFVQELWPTVRAALDWVVSLQRPDGTILWAREVDEAPWDYALLTGCSSIWHALESGVRLATIVGDPQPGWARAADRLGIAVRDLPHAFEAKDRWAMDWYYPVLGGALTGEAAKARLAEGWTTFVHDDRGVRCVCDEPWITAAETAECSMVHTAIGDRSTAVDLLRWTRAHRCDDGAYWTGFVYPERVTFPAAERTAYTAAAVILAADAITGTSAGSDIFLHRPDDD